MDRDELIELLEDAFDALVSLEEDGVEDGNLDWASHYDRVAGAVDLAKEMISTLDENQVSKWLAKHPTDAGTMYPIEEE